MSRVALGAPDVVTPVIAASEIVMGFFAGMAGETRFRRSLRVKGFEGNDLALISAAFNVLFTRAVAGLAPYDLSTPRRKGVQFSVFCTRHFLRLIVMARGTGVTTDVLVVGDIDSVLNEVFG